MFFALSVVDYLFGVCGNVRASIGDIPDCDVHNKLFKVSLMYITKMINNPHPLHYSFRKFKILLNSDEYLFQFDCSVSQPATSFLIQNKGNIISSIVMPYYIYSCKAEFDQLRQGLLVLGFTGLMDQQPVRNHSSKTMNVQNKLQMFYRIFFPNVQPSRVQQKGNGGSYNDDVYWPSTWPRRHIQNSFHT